MRLFRPLFIGFIGFVVLIIGLIMIVTPGPAFILIPAGLSILAPEFKWANFIVRRVRALYVLLKRKRRKARTLES